MKRIYMYAVLLCSSYGMVQAKSTHDIAVYRRDKILMPQEGEYVCFELRDAVKEFEKRVQSQMGSLRKREQDLQNRANEANQADFERMADLMKDKEAIKIDSQLLQRKLEQEQLEVGRAFEQKIDDVLEAIRTEEKLLLICNLTAGSVADESIDITDKVVERLNENYRKEQRAKKLKAPAAVSTQPANKPAAKA